MNESRTHLLCAIESGQVAHAYIISGDASLAQDAAALLLCESANTKKPCGTCKGCVMRAAQSHPDLLHVVGDQTGARVTIKIDAVRALQEELSTKSARQGYRIVLIKDAHCMTQQAQNALLKTLEEPEAGIVFFLIGNEAGLLPTVRSRCVILRSEHEESEGDPELKALTLKNAPMLIKRPSELLSFYYEHKGALEEILLYQTLWLRDILVRELDAGPLLTGGEAPKIDRKTVLVLMELLTKTRKRLRANANPSLAADALVVKIAQALSKELPKEG